MHLWLKYQDSLWLDVGWVYTKATSLTNSGVAGSHHVPQMFKLLQKLL